MHSRIYSGWVRHRRATPTAHRFRYRLFMMYLDLAELPALFDGVPLWSARRPALAWFRRADYLGPADVPLDAAVRDLVEARLGARPRGPIRLLTHLRYFGYCMNPVSFYYCFDPQGRRVETIVAEITNTPWGERHQYVLSAAQGLRFRFAKQFHVSPFMPMQMQYDWRFGEPGERLAVHMRNFRDGAPVFDATLSLTAAPVGTAGLLRALALQPAMTVRVIAGIYWQALRLWLKRTPFHSHPRTAERGGERPR
ncbi:MAG: DUF1365 domain-containing protein [Gammaproteobacteria bacterium]|nr:DUF1365 domain-containing protein [Gammaproteobacteria bacterium]